MQLSGALGKMDAGGGATGEAKQAIAWGPEMEGGPREQREFPENHLKIYETAMTCRQPP